MKIDLHVHTNNRSDCASSSEHEQIQAAIDNGLDAIVFTDHGSQRTPEELEKLNRRYAPFKIFAGVEINVSDSHEDILIIGVWAMSDYNHKPWTYPELHKFARRHNGFIAVPHPYRYTKYIRTDVEMYPPDAFELRSKNIDPKLEPKILGITTKLGLRNIVTSDAHRTLNVGQNYVELDYPVNSEEELVEALQTGSYRLSQP